MHREPDVIFDNAPLGDLGDNRLVRLGLHADRPTAMPHLLDASMDVDPAISRVQQDRADGTLEPTSRYHDAPPMVRGCPHYFKRVAHAEIARRLLRSFDNSTVTLISISRSAGAVADAAYYSTQTGRLLRRAQTRLGTKDEQSHLFALARFVAKGLESPEVTVLEKWGGESPLASSGPVTTAPANDSLGVNTPSTGGATTTANSPAAEPGRSSDGHPHVVPGVVIGIGAVALGAGIYLSATAKVDPSGPRSQYVYSGPGIGLAVGGALAVGVGMYLWHRASQSQHRRSAPTLSVTATGTAIGWASEF